MQEQAATYAINLAICAPAGLIIRVKLDDKIKSVVVDNCDKVGIAMQDVLGAVEIVNCKSLYLHCQGSVQTCQADKADGVNIFAHTEKSESMTVVHSLSQNLNFNVMEN